MHTFKNKFMFLMLTAVFMLFVPACGKSAQQDPSGSTSPYVGSFSNPDELEQEAAAGDEDFLSYLDTLPQAPPAKSHKEFLQQETSWWQSISTCMNERGWANMKVENPGTPLVSLSGGPPEGQIEPFYADFKKCGQMAGASPQYPVTDENMANARYDELTKVANCLKDHGYEVTEAPSRQTFVDQEMRKELTWDPKADVLTKIRPEALYEMCPYEIS